MVVCIGVGGMLSNQLIMYCIADLHSVCVLRGEHPNNRFNSDATIDIF